MLSEPNALRITSPPCCLRRHEVTRKDFDPGELSSRDFYRLLTAVVVPRPIAWVSSRSAEGVDNLAPHSFFTVASVDPPIIQFTSVGEKDTLRNIRSRGEFVVNLAPAGLMAEVNATGTNFPPDVSEFDAAGVTREARLGLDEWGTTGTVRELQRIRRTDWPGGFRRKNRSVG